MVVQISPTFNLKNRGQNNLPKNAIPLLFALEGKKISICKQKTKRGVVKEQLRVLTFFL